MLSKSIKGTPRRAGSRLHNAGFMPLVVELGYRHLGFTALQKNVPFLGVFWFVVVVVYFNFFFPPTFLLLLYELRLFGSSGLKEIEQLTLMLLLQVHGLAFGCENLGSPQDIPRQSGSGKHRCLV